MTVEEIALHALRNIQDGVVRPEKAAHLAIKRINEESSDDKAAL